MEAPGPISLVFNKLQSRMLGRVKHVCSNPELHRTIHQCSSKARFILHKCSVQKVPAGKEEEKCEDRVALHGLFHVSVQISSAFIQVVWLKGENFIAFVPFWSQDLRKWLSSYNYFLKYSHNISSWARSFSWLPWHNSHQIWGTCCPLSPNVIYFSCTAFSAQHRGAGNGGNAGLRDSILGIDWTFWHTGSSYNFSSYELEWIYLLNL